MSVEVERVREGYCNFCASVRRRDGARAKDIDMVSQPPPVTTQNGLNRNDTTHSATPLEKAAESLRWEKSTNNPARQWTKIKDAEETSELKQVLAFVRSHAVNGYATIGAHVYRIEGDGQFLGRYPKREASKA